jgi:hypothetical protein
MPHPENASEPILGSQDGLLIFESMLQYMEDGEFHCGKTSSSDTGKVGRRDLDA